MFFFYFLYLLNIIEDNMFKRREVGRHQVPTNC